MNTFKKWWPEVVIVGSWIAANFGPALVTVATNWVGSHPHWGSAIAAVAVLAARISKSQLTA